MSTTIRKGLTKSFTNDFDEQYTIGDLLSDKNILGILGAGENVRAVSSGETLMSSELVSSFDVITLEEAAATKA